MYCGGKPLKALQALLADLCCVASLIGDLFPEQLRVSEVVVRASEDVAWA